MLVLGVHPLEDAARPGESVQAAPTRPHAAEVDVGAALAWRDFMVSNYSDAGQERWLADRNIDLLRGNGKLAGQGAVEVDGVRHTARHIVVATAPIRSCRRSLVCARSKVSGAPTMPPA